MTMWRNILGGTFTLGFAWGVAQLNPEAGIFVGAIALYTRIQRDGNLDNDTRKRIFDRVRTSPGESISQIASTVGVSHSTASYHLDRLVEFKLLTATPDGNKVRFFINGGIFTEEDRRVLSALTNNETRRVLATILANPGSYRAELTNILDVSSPTVNWHLTRLLAANLVREENRGRNRYLFADPGRIGSLLQDLNTKVEDTDYDNKGLKDLRRLCGTN